MFRGGERDKREIIFTGFYNAKLFKQVKRIHVTGHSEEDMREDEDRDEIPEALFFPFLA